MEKIIMQNDVEPQEDVKFGYTASIVFLIFIGFIIYISLSR